MNVQTKPPSDQGSDAAQIVAELGRRAKAAAMALRNATTAAKNKALTDGARMIRAEKAAILAANARDIDAAKAAGMSSALQLVPARRLAVVGTQALDQGVAQMRRHPGGR